MGGKVDILELLLGGGGLSPVAEGMGRGGIAGQDCMKCMKTDIHNRADFVQ